MYSTSDQDILNNCAAEPTMYFAEYPSQEQQKRYAFQGALATLLITSILLVSFSIS